MNQYRKRESFYILGLKKTYKQVSKDVMMTYSVRRHIKKITRKTIHFSNVLHTLNII